MRFTNSAGRWRSREASEVARLTGRLRAWRHAGLRYATAEDIARDIDQVAEKFPRLARRLDCLKSHLMAVILDSLVMIPNSPPVY